MWLYTDTVQDGGFQGMLEEGWKRQEDRYEGRVNAILYL